MVPPDTPGTRYSGGERGWSDGEVVVALVLAEKKKGERGESVGRKKGRGAGGCEIELLSCWTTEKGGGAGAHGRRRRRR